MLFSKYDYNLGTFTSVKHKIDIGSQHPICQEDTFPHEGDHVDKMLASGVVVPSSSEWASPVVLARKKDRGVCQCIDYR